MLALFYKFLEIFLIFRTRFQSKLKKFHFTSSIKEITTINIVKVVSCSQYLFFCVVSNVLIFLLSSHFTLSQFIQKRVIQVDGGFYHTHKKKLFISLSLECDVEKKYDYYKLMVMDESCVCRKISISCTTINQIF